MEKEKIQEQFLKVLTDDCYMRDDFRSKQLEVLGHIMIELYKLDYTKEMWEKEKALETEIAIKRAEFDKERKVKAWDTLKSTGALQAFTEIVKKMSIEKFGIENKTSESASYIDQKAITVRDRIIEAISILLERKKK